MLASPRDSKINPSVNQKVLSLFGISPCFPTLSSPPLDRICTIFSFKNLQFTCANPFRSSRKFYQRLPDSNETFEDLLGSDKSNSLFILIQHSEFKCPQCVQCYSVYHSAIQPTVIFIINAHIFLKYSVEA